MLVECEPENSTMDYDFHTFARVKNDSNQLPILAQFEKSQRHKIYQNTIQTNKRRRRFELFATETNETNKKQGRKKTSWTTLHHPRSSKRHRMNRTKQLD